MSFKLPTYNQLNETQKLVIQTLDDTNKVAVIGGPGTGKTIVGLQAVGLMGESKSLFITYSKPLIASIKSAAKLHQLNIENVEFKTYHSWLWEILKQILGKIDPSFNNQSNNVQNDKIKKYLSEHKLQKEPFVYNVDVLDTFIKQHLRKIDSKYEYIFIDEAQDIQDHLIKVFMNFTKNIFLTYDDSQKIGNEDNDNYISYDHSNVLIDLGIGDKFFDLIDNYRNTKQVENAARDLMMSYDVNDISLSRITATREGEYPNLIHFHSYSDNWIDSLTKFIVDRYDKSKSVCILFGNQNRDLGFQTFKGLRDALKILQKENDFDFYYKYGTGYDNDKINENNALNNGIFLMTYKSCKGLEFDEVYVIVDNASIDNYQQKNAFFVSFTRSKDLTNVVIFDDKTDNLTKLIFEKRALFNEIEMEDEE